MAPPWESETLSTSTIPRMELFVPQKPTTTPQELFPLHHRLDRQFPRFTSRSCPETFLIYTDGACLNNGRGNARGGWGFVFRAPEPDLPLFGRVSGPLEELGPSGKSYPQTSNRAELRAVIAALQFRVWAGDRWKRLVIATDSEYVAIGATQWVRRWSQNGWMTRNGTSVQNRDLWEELLREAVKAQEYGLGICFWKIPRAWNTVADEMAKKGATEEVRREFSKTMGILL